MSRGILVAALVALSGLALAQEGELERDPFQTPPAMEEAAQREPAPQSGRLAPARSTLRVLGVLRLRGRAPGAIVAGESQRWLLRPGDLLSWAGRSWRVEAIDERGVCLMAPGAEPIWIQP